MWCIYSILPSSFPLVAAHERFAISYTTEVLLPTIFIIPAYQGLTIRLYWGTYKSLILSYQHILTW